MFKNGFLMACSSVLLLTGCGDRVNFGFPAEALGNVTKTFKTIATEATGAKSLQFLTGYNDEKAGVPTSYCLATGAPTTDGSTEVSTTNAAYPGHKAFCLSTSNSLSPDTAAGAMYIAAGIVCSAANDKLFLGLNPGVSQSTTLTVDFRDGCWGTDEEIAAVAADVGGYTLSVNFSITQLTDGPYDYKVEYTAGNTETLYLSNRNGVIAAMNDQGWAFNFNTNTGKLLYESISPNNGNRMRLLIQGSVGSDNSMSTITQVSGFYAEGTADSTTYTNLTVFNGIPSEGFKSSTRTDNATITSNHCYKPGGGEDCSNSTNTDTITTDAAAQALLNNMTAAKNNLAANTGALLDFSTIDPTDFDITD